MQFSNQTFHHMRLLNYFVLLVLISSSNGCKQKSSMHKVVQFDQQMVASDDLYIQYLSEQIDQYPDQADGYIKLADIYISQNNDTKAVDLLQKASRNLPGNLNVLIHLSTLYLQNEDIEKLSASLERIKRINPDHMDFLKLSAGHSLLTRDYANAIFFANRAMLANPYDDENFYLRGSAQLINNDSLAGIESFEKAYELKKSYRNFSKCFDVLLALNEKSRAKAYLDDFGSTNAEQPLCYEFGSYLSSLRERDRAKSVLLNCLADDQEEERVKYELAKIYYQKNNTDSALFYINQYLDSKPKGTAAFVLKAKTLEQISYYTEARNLYNIALKVDSTSILAQRGLENLERKVAYLRLKKRKENLRRQTEVLKPLNSKDIN
jgi:lipopolysaccharide biosynthesis regulator YciM